MKRLITVLKKTRHILWGNFVIITEKDGKVSADGIMPENRLKLVINQFNQQLNS
jgi:hypothetical protein